MEALALLIIAAIAGAFGYAIGKGDARTEIVADRRICATAKDAGQKFERCWDLVEQGEAQREEQ